MSHQTEYEGGDMNELSLITKAVRELGGELEQAETYQGYGASRESCTHKISFHNCKYEVGLQVKDGKVSKMNTDWWAGHMAKKVGENYGKLKKHYNAVRVEREAKRKGYTTRRKIVGEQIQITVGGM